MEGTSSSHPLRAAFTPLLLSLIALLGLAAWVGGLLPVQWSSATTGGVSEPSEARPVIEPIELLGHTGATHRVGGRSEFPATVIVYLGSTCPISRAYLPMLKRLGQATAGVGVKLLVIQVDTDIDLATELGTAVAVVSESTHAANRDLRSQLRPTHVPESFVIDSSGRLCYRGRIDDRYIDVGRRRARVTSRDLARAIDTVLAGRSRSLVRTTPVGCVLEEIESNSGAFSGAFSGEGPVTWTSHVASLVHRRCGRCHREDASAPFSLLSHTDVASRSRQVLDVLTRRIMPPWKPRPGFGHFQGDMRLSERELSLLRGWLESGLPPGDLSRAPESPEYPGGWLLGEPDLVLSMPSSVQIPAEGSDIYWYFVIPSGLQRDRMISAIDFHPGNPRVVHHASFRYDDTGRARRLDAADPALGYRRFGGWGFGGGGTLGGWAVGVEPRRLAAGLGRRIAGGSDLVVQVHYHPSGRIEHDRSQLGLYFVDLNDPASQGSPGQVTPVIEVAVGEMSLEIPAGESDLYHRAEYTLPVPVTVHSLLPHMHLLGRRCRSWAETPDGRQLPLVAIDDWDFNWQSRYHLRRPLRIPGGSRLIHEAWYDNSSANPFNPHVPPRRVTWGEGTDQEMGLLFLDVTTDSEADRRRLIRHNQAHFGVQIRRLTGGG